MSSKERAHGKGIVAPEALEIKVGALTGIPAPKPTVKAAIEPKIYEEFVKEFMNSSHESIIVKTDVVKKETLRTALRKTINKLGYGDKIRTVLNKKDGNLYLVKK